MNKISTIFRALFLTIVSLGAAICPVMANGDRVAAQTDIYEVPAEIQESCERWGAYYNISPEFLEAVCWQESNYHANAVNSAGTCFGCMQVKQSAHAKRMAKLGVTNLFDVDQNIHVAADYFTELFEEYEDPAACLMIFHGESNVEAKLERGEMSTYAENILIMSVILERRHGKYTRAHFNPLTADWENAVG